MAEIRVVRDRRGGLGWLWAVLLLLLLAGAAYWLWTSTGRPGGERPAGAETAPTGSLISDDAAGRAA